MSSKTLAPTIPPELWRKSPRPGTSMTLRLSLAGGFALAGLISAAPAIKGVCLGLAVLSFVVIPVLGDRLLTPIEAEVEAANRSDARKLLKDIEGRWAVRWFAPSAWLAVQQARLQLSSGDPRAAAMSYFEARRASSLGASRPELTSAEADAHLHADDRKQALKLLRELEDKKTLAPLDHVNFGVALLSESGQSEAARDHFEQAYKALSKEPRVVAGLALARQRCGDIDGARELLEGELELDRSEDRTARDLAKRARKGLKGKGGDNKSGKKKKKKKDKKGKKKAAAEAPQEAEPQVEAAPKGTPEAEAAPKADAPAKSKKEKDKKSKKDKPKGKKARRAARREARKKKEAEERAAKAAQREKAEREALEKQQAERDRAAAKAKRASQVKTIPAEMPLTAPTTPIAKSKPKPVVPKAPAAASGTLGAPKPSAPAAPKAPAPPKVDSLFGSMFAPPKPVAPAAAPKPAAPPKTPATAVTPPAAGKAPTPPKVVAPSLDDLFAPPSGGSGPSLPPPPVLGAPPVVPPPPISAPKASAPPKLDDWGSDLGLPAAPVVPPPVSKPKTDDKK